jgi:glycosyltransferase involved in cell wall biosynthesis
MTDTLRAAGAAVTIVSDAPLKLDAEHESMPVVVVEDSKRFRWEQKALRSHLRESNYDVYVATNNVGLPALYRGKTHLALVVHDMIPLLFWRQYLVPNPRNALRHVVAQVIAARRANSIFTVSHASQHAIKRLLMRDATVIPPTIALSQPLPKAHRAEHPYFIYVGGYDPRKNARSVVRAFARLQNSSTIDMKLVMTGRPTAEITDEIARQGIRAHVELPGVVSEEEKWALLRGAIASLYPSNYEGYGLPLVEAFRAEVPIITTTHGALQEVGGEAAVLVDPTSAIDISYKMAQCMDPTFREEHVRRGRRQLAMLTNAATHEHIVDCLRTVVPATRNVSEDTGV